MALTPLSFIILKYMRTSHREYLCVFIQMLWELSFYSGKSQVLGGSLQPFSSARDTPELWGHQCAVGDIHLTYVKVN